MPRFPIPPPSRGHDRLTLVDACMRRLWIGGSIGSSWWRLCSCPVRRHLNRQILAVSAPSRPGPTPPTPGSAPARPGCPSGPIGVVPVVGAMAGLVGHFLLVVLVPAMLCDAMGDSFARLVSNCRRGCVLMRQNLCFLDPAPACRPETTPGPAPRRTMAVEAAERLLRLAAVV